MIETKRHITVGQAQGLLKLAARTVTLLFDSGQLRGFKLPPNHKHRRIELASVLEIMQQNGYPAPTERELLDLKIARETDGKGKTGRRLKVAEVSRA